MQKDKSKMQRVALVAQVVVYVVLALLVVSLLYSLWALIAHPLAGGRTAWLAVAQGGVSFVSLLGLGFICVMLARLLDSIRKEHSPFVQANVRRLKAIALCFLLVAALGIASQAVLGMVAVEATHAPAPMQMAGIADEQAAVYVKTASYGFSTPPLLLVALAVYCIALVFEQGVRLQTFSDETL